MHEPSENEDEDLRSRQRMGKNYRPLGKSANVDAVVEDLRRLLPRLDMGRWFVIYIRKSNPTAEGSNANYLTVQEQLKDKLIAAGVPAPMIQELDEDIGISGVLDHRFRPSLNRLDRWLTKPELVGTLVVMDIARLYRDPTLVGPIILANQLQMNNVKIVTLEESPPKLVDPTNLNDYDYLLAKFQEAAKFRLNIRRVTVEAKEQSFLDGGHTGAPVSVGWAVHPPQRAVDAFGRKKTSPPMLYVYTPHAEIKKQIMWVADHKAIESRRDLLRAIETEGLGLPPFEESIRAYMATRTCLRQRGEKNASGQWLRYDPASTVYPSVHMLYNILLEPLAVGARLYGSGARSGKQKLQAIEKKFAEMGRRHDSLIRDHRVFTGYDPELAICTTEEEIALYWRLCEKWGDWDAQRLRATDFQELVPNPKRVVRPQIGRPLGIETSSSPWGGKVYCLRHGVDEDGNPILSHRITCNDGQGSWQCNKDNSIGQVGRVCTTIGRHDILQRVLDRHFSLRCRDILDGAFSRVAAVSRPNRTAMQEDYERLKADAEALERKAAGMQESLPDMIEAWSLLHSVVDVRVKVKEFTARVEKLILTRDETLRRLEEIAAHVEDIDELHVDVPQPVWEMLKQILTLPRWKEIPVVLRHTLIDRLVEWVGVLCGGTGECREVVIIVQWKSGQRDTLVTWRGFDMDTRAWEEWEDAALRKYWASNCSVEFMQSQLLPRRKYSSVRARGETLGIMYPGRSQAWRQEYEASGKSYGDRNTQTLYFVSYGSAPDSVWTEISVDGVEGTSGILPMVVSEGLASLYTSIGWRVDEE